MDSKRVNRLFLTIMIAYVSVVTFIMFGYRHIESFRVTTEANYVLSEMILILPALLFVLPMKNEIIGILGFHRIHASTIGMLLLATVLLIPLTTFINLITMLYTDNVVLKSSNSVTSMPLSVSLFFIAVLAPFCEEMVCRGVFYYGYEKTGNTMQAMFFSALMFGLLHMNPNQMPYTFCLGLFLALLKEITGSIWAPILVHMFFNGISTISLYLSKWLFSDGMAENIQRFTSNRQCMMAAIGTYAVIAAVSTTLVLCIFVWIENNENKSGFLRKLWYGRLEERGQVVTVPLILGIIISMLYMIRYL